VIPVRNGAGEIIAVFDIDSDKPNAFTETDAAELGNILTSVFARI